MAGSKLSAIFFVLSGLLLLVQTAIAVVAYDDIATAFIAVLFALFMFCGANSAATGAKAPIYEYAGEYDIGGDHVVVQRSTGEYTDAAPLCGCGIGTLLLIIAYLYADLLSYGVSDAEAIAIVSPTILAGIVSIFAGIIYVIQTRD